MAAVSDDRFIAAKTEDALKSQRKRLDRVLQGKVDVRFGPYRLEDISDDDKKHATTSFMTFRPFIRDQIWGGFWLNYLKNHKAFDESVTSETVEISSHPYFPSIMVLKSGISMDVTDVAHFGFADDFFGKRVVKEFGPRFPFIAKFLDAQKALSIQVHPSHEQARDLEKYEDALGKEEVFFIIGAEEDNEMVFGLDEDMSIDRFLEAVRNQDPAIEGMLHRITVQPGEIYRVPYGAVHAFQRGIQAIELGHMSDLTYRIYDYNRKERLPALASDRTVHIPESLGSINFNLPRGKELVDLFKKSWTTTQTLNNGAGKIQTADISPEFHADRFVFMGLGENKGQIIESTTVKTSTDGRFHFLMAAKGSVELRRVLDGQTAILRMGESIFIPAGLGDYEIITNNSLQSIIYRFYPQFPEEYTKYNIAISLGGSKFMFGLVDKNGSILHDREFNWKEKLRGEDITADRIEELMMDELAQLLDRFAIRPDQIEEIGIAWPGPIDYQTRRVTATYLPFDKHPLAETISRRYMDRYQHKVDVKPILDVLADILGEKKHTKGALQGKSDGMVLNLATGIAMGILKDDEILDSASYDAPDQNSPMIIETGLPQIGRHLIRRKSDPKSWEYRPTPDGSVPNFDNNQYERFSQALGGPFIARRYIETLIGEYGADHTGYFEKAPEMPLKDIAEKLAQRNNSDEAVTVEKMVLTELTTKAYDGDETAADLVKKIGYEFGSALATFVRSFPKIFNIADHEWDLVLVGSVGEKLGNPKRLEGIYQYYDDIFLPAFQQGLDDNGAKGVKVSRSEMEQDGKRIREIVAFQSDSTDKRIFAKLYAEEDQDNAMLGSQNPLLKEINTILKHVTRHGTISQQQIDELSGLIERVRQESPDNDFQIVAEMIKRAQKDSLADYHKADEYGEAALVRENNGAYFSVWFTLRELLHSDSQKIQKLMDEKNLPELHKLVSAKKAKAYTAAVAPLALSYDDRIIITIDSARKIIEFLSINGDRISLETLEELRSDLAETLYFLTHSPHYDNLSAAEYQFYEKHRFMLYDDSADKNDLETLIKITEDAITALQSIDSAMLGDQNQAQDVQNGGIDMNEIAVDRANEDAAGTIQFEMQGMEPLLNMDIQGFSPIIIDMVPINSVLPLLGLAPTEKGIKFGKEEAQEGLQLSKIES